MTDKISKRLEKRRIELQRIHEAKARWWKKLRRAVIAMDKLDAEEKRLLKPRKLEPHESNAAIASKDWHKIREQDFDDAIPPW